MGHYKDLGTGTVASVDPVTGYPMDEYKHLLGPQDANGELVEGWQEPGTELFNLTSPYGFLQFANGNGDDFLCMDYTTINVDEGKYLILHTVLNSETGSFIQSAGYEVLPVNTRAEKREALLTTYGMMDGGFEDVRHSVKGWNQDVWYWSRCVARALFPDEMKKFSERQMRHGGKRIEAAINNILNKED
jgi:hypothetical protein